MKFPPGRGLSPSFLGRVALAAHVLTWQAPGRSGHAATAVAFTAVSTGYQLVNLLGTEEPVRSPWGPVEHVESGIDEAVLEDEPPSEAMRRLIRKVESLLRPS